MGLSNSDTPRSPGHQIVRGINGTEIIVFVGNGSRLDMRRYMIADLSVYMDTWGRTRYQAEKYEIDYDIDADIIIESEYKLIKDRFPSCSDDEAEYLGTGADFYRKLLVYDGMMLHSSSVIVDEQAYLFAADSGVGKSTHTCNWIKVFGEQRALILNDDKPALRIRDNIVYAYGTPWSGKTSENLNLRVPVAGICILERGEKNTIERCSGIEAIHKLLKQTPKPKYTLDRALVLENLDKILSQVPIWKLKCNMEPEAAIVSYEAMSGKKWEGR